MGDLNPHANHRSRLRTQYLRAGLLEFPPHNVLELLLFYPILRRDTNGIAHALVRRFGSVGAVLLAERRELLSVEGVGEGVCRFFSALRALASLALSGRGARHTLGDAATLAERCAALLGEGEGERTLLLFLDNELGEISHLLLPGVSLHSSRFSPATAAREAILRHAPTLVVAHVHADGLALPATEDLDSARELRDVCEAAGVRLLETLIVGGGRFATLLYRCSGEYAASYAGAERAGEEEAATLAELFAASHLSLPVSPCELLASYGGLYHLLSASPARHRHAGLSPAAAALLSLVFATKTYAALGEKTPPAHDTRALGEHLVSLYRTVGVETALLLLFDPRGVHLATHVVGVGSVGEATFSCRRVAEGALFAGAAGAVLAHNHPHGTAAPSGEDRAATRRIAGALSGLGIDFLRHYVVGWDGFSLIE